MPAHRPDVGIVHAQRADRRGNVQMWGILGVQKEAVLAASRSIVTVEEIVDELDPQPGAVVLPALGRRRGRARAGRRPSVVRARLLRARQRVLRRLGRDQPRPRRASSRGCAVTCSARPTSASTARASRRRRWRCEQRRRTRLRGRDDGGRGGAAAARRRPSASSASACRASPRTSRGGRTRPAACSSTRAARSARSRPSCRSRSATASSRRPRTPSSRCRRCSPTGSRAAGSTSASSAPRRSTGTATSTAP